MYHRRNIAIAFTLLLLLFIVLLVAAFRNLQKTVNLTTNVDRTFRALRILEDLMDDVQDIETAHRGFTISADSAFLTPYQSARNRLKEDTVQVKKLSALFNDREKDFKRVLEYVNYKLKFVDQNIYLVSIGKQDSAAINVRSGEGKKIMDTIRSILNRVENEENASLQAANIDRQRATNSSAKSLVALVITMMAGFIVLAFRIYQDIRIREENEQQMMMRNLTVHIQAMREEERAHIAREIHDQLGQQLTVLKMDISWLNKKINSSDEKIKEKMTDLVQMIDSTVHSVRSISSELRPSMLDDLGLQAALEWQAQEFEKRSGIKVISSLEINDIILPGNIGITFFRIFQESLTNVARHAQATEVHLRLWLTDEKLQMTVTDNGRGFSPKNISEKRTLGLLGMKERAATIGGEFEVISSEGAGTTVMVKAPVAAKKEKL